MRLRLTKNIIFETILSLVNTMVANIKLKKNKLTTKIIFLVGAGASIDISVTLSTQSLTNIILEGKDFTPEKKDDVIKLIKQAYEFISHYKNNITFETIYQFLLDTLSDYEENRPTSFILDRL